MRIKYTDDEKKKLLDLDAVLSVGDVSITYTPEFKVYAVKAYLYAHKSAKQIFIEAGFDLGVIQTDTPKECLKRWRRVFEKEGELGLLGEQRGLNSIGRPLSRELSIKEKLKRAEMKIKYLEKENALLKKLDAIERSVIERPSLKYQLIEQIIDQVNKTALQSVFTVQYLCNLADVSRSGYYYWKSNTDKRILREQKDVEDFKCINEIFQKMRQKAGWRTVKMELESELIQMNHKKIRRIMKKFNLITKVRKRNPYKQMAKATKEHRTFSNLVDRNFTPSEPFTFLGTDITYLYYQNGQKAYLSIVKDFASGEIISEYISSSLGIELSLEPIKQMQEKYPISLRKSMMLHSDQGFHYTNPQYISLLARSGITQSMSRKGNCIDNAPVESFFGHFKDEVDLKTCATFEEVKAAVLQYINRYNNIRKQWNKKKMTPVEYRNHLLAA